MVSKSDSAGPQRIIHSLRWPIAAESAQPHEVKISVLIAVFIGVTFFRFERAIAVVVGPWIERVEVGGDVALCGAHEEWGGVVLSVSGRMKIGVHDVIAVGAVHAEAQQRQTGRDDDQ